MSQVVVKADHLLGTDTLIDINQIGAVQYGKGARKIQTPGDLLQIGM